MLRIKPLQWDHYDDSRESFGLCFEGPCYKLPEYPVLLSKPTGDDWIICYLMRDVNSNGYRIYLVKHLGSRHLVFAKDAASIWPLPEIDKVIGMTTEELVRNVGDEDRIIRDMVLRRLDGECFPELPKL